LEASSAEEKAGEYHCHWLVGEMGFDVDEIDAGDEIEGNEALGARSTCGHDEETPNLVVAGLEGSLRSVEALAKRRGAMLPPIVTQP
jgi:hypothetical protein